MKKLINLITVFAVVLLMATSCKDYQEAVYEDVSNSETAFVIPLEASSKSGAKLSPAEYNSHKVMSKKILIPTRWHQTGRMWFDGKWVPTVKVIKVNRAPVNGNWSGKNAITVESQDSIDFSVAFNCTAEIPDENAATYLYGYPAKDLSSVMNSEIRQMVQQIVSEVSARYVMDELRSKKPEIVSEVRRQVIPHFAKKGIVVTTLGMSSGFQYANPKIQESLDSIVVVQQLKEEEAAKLSAMADQIKRKEAEAQAEADYAVKIAEGESKKLLIEKEASAKALLIDEQAKADALLISAKSQADAKVVAAEAKAKEMEYRIKALNTGGQSESYLRLKELEVQAVMAERWQGGVPTISGGQQPLQHMDVSALVPAIAK